MALRREPYADTSISPHVEPNQINNGDRPEQKQAENKPAPSELRGRRAEGDSRITLEDDDIASLAVRLGGILQSG